jgi:hypothetical protein
MNFAALAASLAEPGADLLLWRDTLNISKAQILTRENVTTRER